MATKTTRITVETETQVVIRRAKTDLAWCPVCRAEVDAVTLDNDSIAEPETAAQIQEWLGSRRLHFWRSARGLAAICLPSLFQCLELDEVQRLCRPHQKPHDPLRRK